MSDNQYIKKQQRTRRKLFLTTRQIFLIILLSAIIYGGFYFEYGAIDDGSCTGTCEAQYSLWTWVLGFVIMFSMVIALGALVGGVIAFLKWSRGRNTETLSALTGDTPEPPADD